MKQPILTIAVPIYNMERWLDKNLGTYRNPALYGRLEVLCLNNASEDGSKAVIQRYVDECPQIFALVDRNSRGYGESVNEALAYARGMYFRIVDADDWVDTMELVRLVDALENCDTDIALTDYEIVNMQTGAMTPVTAGSKGVEYGKLFFEFSWPLKTLPSIHGTTYRTALLRESGFRMQDGIFFVDEEYVILPYLFAKSVIYYPFDIYRYQVANPAQSTSPQNRAKYHGHREKVLRRLIADYQTAHSIDSGEAALFYCYERIKRGVGDHFTTLYMYIENRRTGRRLAKEWRGYIRTYAPEFWPPVKKKAAVLSLLNRLRISLEQYNEWKRWLNRCKGKNPSL